MDELGRHDGQGLRLDPGVRQVHELQAELLGQGLEDVQLGADPLLQEDLVERAGGLGGLGFLRPADVGLGQLTLFL